LLASVTPERTIGKFVMILEDAAHYRQKACEMRTNATRTRSEELRAAYLQLADNWEGMADTAEDQRGMPIPAQPEDSSHRGPRSGH
jgi:hypothetical protein